MAKAYKIFFLLVFVLTVPSGLYAAELHFSPALATYSVGKTFTVNLLVSSGEQALNAVGGEVFFSPEVLSVVSVSKEQSVVNLWVSEPSFSNTAGSISFEGVALNPGFQGSGGKVLSIAFRAKTAGVADVRFVSGSVLANDGTGTNIIEEMRSASFTIRSAASDTAESSPVPSASPRSEPKPAKTAAGAPSAPDVMSSSHPDSERWYANTTATFRWDVPNGTTAVRLLYGTKESIIPTILYPRPISEKVIEDIPDGTYYFHAQLKNDAGWSPARHFKFNVDSTKPVISAVVHLPERSTPGQAIFSITARDAHSGIDHYEISVNNNEPEIWSGSADGTYDALIPSSFLQALTSVIISTDAAKEHTLTVSAVDGAGNKSSQTVQFLGVSSVWIKETWLVKYTSVLALGILTMLLAWFLWRYACNKKAGRVYISRVSDMRSTRAHNKTYWQLFGKVVLMLARILLIVVTTPLIILFRTMQEIYHEVLRTFASGTYKPKIKNKWPPR